MTGSNQFTAGEQWTYRAPQGFEASRLVIGAIVTFADHDPIICCAVQGAPRQMPNGRIDSVTIPFLPMSSAALSASVRDKDGEGHVPPGFAAAFETWQDDPRGLSIFTVPFEGRLDTLIARQMAEGMKLSA